MENNTGIIINLCPFCWSEAVNLTLNVDGSYCILCDNCYARGPSVTSVKLAINLWNTAYPMSSKKKG